MITRKTWKCWREGKTYHYRTYIFQQLRELNLTAPEVYVSQKDFKILKALNNDFRERTLMEIRYLTGLSYPFVSHTVKEFEREGLVITKKTKTTRKKREKKTNKRYVKLTEKGIKALKEWEEIYSHF